ncbi:MAG TPA: ABC transporter permease [Conexibacter sp.]|jgi:ABC-type dipeptide/oligopeptide/nickel transport system permease component|nr:ABC transporter permease [Conexibacter sp.]
MVRFIATRVVQGLLVVFGAATISFLLTSVSGNAVDARYSNLDAATRARLIHQYGYDQPLPVRYVHYLGNLLHGDFGPSSSVSSSPLARVGNALPYTLTLVGCAIVLATLIAVAVATYGAIRRESRVAVGLRRTFMALQGIPEFFVGLVLVLVFAVQLGWLPSFGANDASSYVLPVAALTIPLISTLTRLMRSQLLDVLGRDFVVALRAKGLTQRQIVLRHGLRNSAPPLITYLALQLGWLLGGTLIVEVVFGIPGIGSLVVASAGVRDVATVQAVVVVVAIGYVALNLLADLAVYAIDPRIRRPA